MINPVLRREAQTSLRNWKIFAAITVYVSLIAGAAGIFIWGNLYSSYTNGFDPKTTVMMYAILSGFQLGLILITVPALTAGSISGERERQTLDLLLITKMSPFAIIFGKLISSLGIVILMILSTVPIFAIIFYFGGLSLLSLLGMTLFLLVVACMVGSISIFFSTIFKKTVVSMVLVYLLIGILTGGTMIAFLIYSELAYEIYDSGPGFFSVLVFLTANPGVGFFSIIDHQTGSDVISRIFDLYWYYVPTSSGMPPDYQLFIVNHFWLVNGIFNITAMFFFTFLSSRMIRPLRKK